MVVSFHSLAKLELTEAAQYYENESPGLGQALISEIERCTDEIVRHPDAGLVMRGSIRRRLVRRFPYGLLYRATASEVRVLAVMNLKRRPSYWVGRR
jgi:plasmid stabilization system protein ParE